MRTRLLALLAIGSAALGTALVALPPHAEALDTPYWTLCSSPSQERCIESAKANGADVLPGPAGSGPARDFPWAKDVAGSTHLIDFGVLHDTYGDGSSLDYTGIDPTKTYVLVIRTGDFRPREMDAIAKNGDFSISGSAGHWRMTVQFQPTAIHHTDAIPCSFDGGCGDSTTRANNDYPVIATGGVDDLQTPGNGLSSREVYARTGMFTTTNAQNSYPFYDIDTATLQIRMANPHLDTDGLPVTDGTYDAFIPNAYLTYVVGVPDPSMLTASSFVVTKTVGGTTTSAPYSITVEPGGVRIKLSGISFSRPRFNVKVRPTAPGKPRLYKVLKPSKHTARAKFSAPIANGRARIDKYQARCHAARKAWHYRSGKGSPLTVGNLPKRRVYCQVRAHNAKGWGRYSAVLHS